jgi:transcriptional regulator with XRE-family HTH domain
LAASRAVYSVLRDVGGRIREARVSANLTQEEAAGRAGVDYKRLQRIEAGKVNVTIRTLVRLATALEVSVWQLMRQDAERSRSR